MGIIDIIKGLFKSIWSCRIVRCISKKEDVQNFGSNTGDLSKLTIGAIYIVVKVKKHSYYTALSLMWVEGTFNSCLFDYKHNREGSYG